MPSEVKSSMNDRLAELEADNASLRRQVNEQRMRGRRVDQLPVLYVRTQGNDPDDPNDATYPEQTQGVGAKLPIVFLDIDTEHPEEDPVMFIPRSAKPQAWLYSPFGWVPRLMDLVVHKQNGIYVAGYIPMLEVEITESGGIDAGSVGEVKIVKHGTADDQTFNVYFNHMTGDSGDPAEEGQEAVVKLWEGRKQWGMPNLECPS